MPCGHRKVDLEIPGNQVTRAARSMKPMTEWTEKELSRIGRAEEVDVASLRRDGTVHNRVTIWLVRHDDDLFVRSAVKGRNAAWFRAAQKSHRGRIWAGGIEKDVTFVDADHSIDDEI